MSIIGGRVEIASVSLAGETLPSDVAVGADVVGQCFAADVVVFRADKAEDQETERGVVEIWEVVEFLRGRR